MAERCRWKANGMLKIIGAGLVIVAAAAIASAGLADPLPTTAKPLSSDAVTKLYAGKTAVGKDSDIFFAPSGIAKGILGKPKAASTLMGTWSVAANEICLYIFRNKDPTTYRDCYKYWQDGGHIITLWSSRSDGTAADEKTGYYRGEESKLKPDDLVSGKYDAAGGS